jgi:amidohydrolase
MFMKDNRQLKQDIDTAYANLGTAPVDISDYLYAHPETAFKEYKAVERLTAALAEEGFSIEKISGGPDTAFTAIFEQALYDETPVQIGIVAEYDALPGIGHACGHNLIAAAAFGAAAALKRVMQSAEIPGVIKVLGTPAEEDGGGKIMMIKKGAFEGLSVCMMMHPTSGVTRIAGGCLSSHGLTISWSGVPAHAEAHPEDGINALDALHIYYTAVACLRQQLPQDVRIAQIVTHGGDDLGMIPSNTALAVDIVSTDANLDAATQKIKRCAEGAAVAAGCTVTIEDHTGYLGRLPNQTLSELFKANLSIIGEPVMDGMPADFGTTDFGNVMRLMPCCNPYVSLLPERKISNHTEEFLALAHSPRAVRVIEIGAKAMAYSAIDLLTDRTALQAASAEFERSQSDS